MRARPDSGGVNAVAERTTPLLNGRCRGHMNQPESLVITMSAPDNTTTAWSSVVASAKSQPRRPRCFPRIASPMCVPWPEPTIQTAVPSREARRRVA